MRGNSANTITVNVPIAFKRRRGRKRVVAPDGTELTPASPSLGEIDSALVKAIARAFRWQRMLESGEHATLRELANAERVDTAYVSRVMRLTLLAPTVIEAILAGRQSDAITIHAMSTQLPLLWSAQHLSKNPEIGFNPQLVTST